MTAPNSQPKSSTLTNLTILTICGLVLTLLLGGLLVWLPRSAQRSVTALPTSTAPLPVALATPTPSPTVIFYPTQIVLVIVDAPPVTKTAGQREQQYIQPAVPTMTSTALATAKPTTASTDLAPSVTATISERNNSTPTPSNPVATANPGAAAAPGQTTSSWTGNIPAAIALAESEPGNWQLQAGLLTYKLPMGAIEAEGLGRIADWPPTATALTATISLQSLTAEPCGIAVGNPQAFSLLRFDTGSETATRVRLLRFAGNFMPAEMDRELPGRYEGRSRMVSLRITDGAMVVEVDGELLGQYTLTNHESVLLYTAGSGCRFAGPQLAVVQPDTNN